MYVARPVLGLLELDQDSDAQDTGEADLQTITEGRAGPQTTPGRRGRSRRAGRSTGGAARCGNRRPGCARLPARPRRGPVRVHEQAVILQGALQALGEAREESCPGRPRARH